MMNFQQPSTAFLLILLWLSRIDTAHSSNPALQRTTTTFITTIPFHPPTTNPTQSPPSNHPKIIVSPLQMSLPQNDNDDNNDDDKDDWEQFENVNVNVEAPPTLFGLERKQDYDALDTGVPLFSGIIILLASLYFTFSVFFLEDSVPIDPSVPLIF